MRFKTGTVSSVKMQKTIVVNVETLKTDPKYHKQFMVTRKFYAHDEGKIAKEGDQVKIRECRPLSKLKRWMLVEVNGQPIQNQIPNL